MSAAATPPPPLGPASQELLDNARRYANEKAKAQVQQETAGWAARQAELERRVEELQEQVKLLSKAQTSRKTSNRSGTTVSGSTTSLKSPSKRPLQQSTSSLSLSRPPPPPQPVFSAPISLSSSTNIPPPPLNTATLDPAQLSKEHTRLQAHFKRLQEKYKALATLHEQTITKHDQERKTWKKFKRMIGNVMQQRPEFREACAEMQKLMDRQDEEEISTALSKTMRKRTVTGQVDQSTVSAATKAPTASNTTSSIGKRKRGQDNQPAAKPDNKRAGGSSSATPTPTKQRSRSTGTSSPGGPVLKPIRTPTKRTSIAHFVPQPKPRDDGHNASSTAEGPISVTQFHQAGIAGPAASTPPPRGPAGDIVPLGFSDCSDAHLAALAEFENGNPTSEAPGLPLLGTDLSAAEAYAKEQSEGNRQAQEQFEQGYIFGPTASEREEDERQMAMIRYYESGAHLEIPDFIADQVDREWRMNGYEDEEDEEEGEDEPLPPSTEQFQELDVVLREEEREIDKLEAERAEDWELQEAAQGPTSSQFRYMEASKSAQPPSTTNPASRDQRNETSNTAGTGGSGLACIFPLPEMAYGQISPSKSVIDESVPAPVYRKRNKAKVASAQKVPLRLRADEGRDGRGAWLAAQATPADEGERSAAKAKIQDVQMDQDDDEETETSSRPSSPARPSLTARPATIPAGNAESSASRHQRHTTHSSKTLMRDDPSTSNPRRTDEKGSSPSPVKGSAKETATQKEVDREGVIMVDNDDTHDSSIRLPAYGKSALFDENTDVVQRTLTNEKLPPRKAKLAEKPKRKDPPPPPLPIEDSNVGSFIQSLRSASVVKPAEGATQTLRRPPAAGAGLLQSQRAGSIEASPGASMWHRPDKKKEKERRKASALVAAASAATLHDEGGGSSKRTARAEMPSISKGKIGSAQVVRSKTPVPDSEQSTDTPQRSSRLMQLPENDQLKAEPAAEFSKSTRLSKLDDLTASVLGRTSAGAAAGLGSSSHKLRKSISGRASDSDTPGDSAKKAAGKKKKGRGGLALPDDIEDDLTAVGRAILQAKGTPRGDGDADTPVTTKRLNVDQLLDQAEKKRKRESAGPSSLSSRLKRKLESEAIVGQAATPTAGSSKKSKVEPDSAKVAGKPALPQRERDYSEPYEGQDFMREIHRQRKAKMEEDPFKYKGKGAYAEQMAGALAAKNLARIEVNPDQNNGVPFIYKETVRGKEARKQLHGVDCDCCHGYLESAVRHLPVEQRAAAIEKMINESSRHRQQFEPTKTPPEYWQMGFPDSQKVEKIRKEAEKMEEEKRKKMEAEASKCDGRFRYR